MTVQAFREKYILGFGYEKNSTNKRFRLIVLERNNMHMVNEVLENPNNTCFQQFLEGKDLNKAILKFKIDTLEEILQLYNVSNVNLSENEIDKYFE
ncbi:hypothetical protein [Wenyingzhuangia sp. 2_MG-2023]|uniref:hypothetical protein n=1 Tax=Wenyingzhuangia sp. 2_MG-2023 TaxID=3062639 RepID=UPI0026E38904|nr:hypothetical protein [Wenyingzhuangia sp. 2_MG-2023]MDO6738045.1 hypothetical protein [Wenyingzhuangia sp. 2_MG-2023]MDO6802601.1 hypothetical protein [Wenyingzhuangia sp. 1_MG-2023]